MATDSETLHEIIRLFDSTFLYIEGTIDLRKQDNNVWITVHKGRASSMMRQLENIKSKIDEYKKNKKDFDIGEYEI